MGLASIQESYYHVYSDSNSDYSNNGIITPLLKTIKGLTNKSGERGGKEGGAGGSIEKAAVDMHLVW